MTILVLLANPGHAVKANQLLCTLVCCLLLNGCTGTGDAAGVVGMGGTVINLDAHLDVRYATHRGQCSLPLGSWGCRPRCFARRAWQLWTGYWAPRV